MKLSCFLLTSVIAFGAEPVDRAPKGPEDMPPRDRPNPREAWREADADKNGSLSFSEFSTLPRIEKLPEDARRKLFERLDKNNNGAIDAPELHPAKEDGRDGRGRFPRLAELDGNKDGKIDFEEFHKAKGFEGMAEERLRKIFNRMDKNEDGFLTPEDRPKDEHRPNFRNWDKNGDGAVDLEEFKATPMAKDTPAEELEKRFRHLDRNGNGKLEGEELAPQRRGVDQPKERREGRVDFKRLDANGDGAVDFEEFKAAPFAKGVSEDALETRFQHMDRNGDKKLDGPEFAPPPKPEGSPRPDRTDDRMPPEPEMDER